MELSRREVPLYGQVQTAAVLQDPACASEEAEFYVLLQGSTLTHVTVARRTSDALSVCFMVPGHDQPERVSVTVFCVSEGTLRPCGAPTSVEYLRDVAQDIAEYLSAHRDHLDPHSWLQVLRSLSTRNHRLRDTDCAGHSEQVVGSCHSHNDDAEDEDRSSDELQGAGVLRELDQNISLALANMDQFPRLHHQWRKNTQQHQGAETPVSPSRLQPRETVLHLAVRLRLLRLSRFLIRQPGGQRLLTLPNQEGDTPLQLAQRTGQHDLFTVLGIPPEPADMGHSVEVWSDGSGSTLRFWPGSDSLSLTLPSDPESRPEESVIALRDRLKDDNVLKRIAVSRVPTRTEGSDHTHTNDADLSKERCVEEPDLVDNVFEEHLVLSLDEEDDDDDVCEELKSFLPDQVCDGADKMDEASRRCKRKVQKSLEPLKDKLKVFERAKTNYDKTENHIKVQARNTETQIKKQFQNLRRFLKEEEDARISAVREEEARKSQEMKERTAVLSREMETLSDAIQAAEDQLRADDHVSFLWNYKTTMEGVQLTLHDPPPLSGGALIDEAKHLKNLTFRVWDKMKDIVSYTPVILDPNAICPWLLLSDDLTSVRCADDEQQLPVNTTRIYSSVLGSEGFNSGSHGWDVEVGDNIDWSVGVWSNAEGDNGSWYLRFIADDYAAFSGPRGQWTAVSVNQKLRRLRVQLDWDRGQLSFSDPDSNTHLHTFTHTFTQTLFPYIYNCDFERSLKMLPGKICVTVENHCWNA